MDDHFPELKTMTVADAQAVLPELAGAVSWHESRVVLAQDGEPVAVLMSLHDLERILEIQEARAALMEFQDRATAAFADVSEEELQEETKRIISNLRAANRDDNDLAATA
jgi:PHD/YefM family antitoxin component YafN of YafNO toxin-antitoxin module